MASLFDGLPAPVNDTPSSSSDAKHKTTSTTSRLGGGGRLVARGAPALAPAPAYGAREGSGFVPRKCEDYGDGGAYPEIHLPQYPRDMGKPGGNKKKKNQTLALNVNATGEVDYGALHRQGDNRGKVVYADHKALVPSLPQGQGTLEKPSEEDIAETAKRTAAALQGKVDTVLSAAQPKSVAPRPGDARYVKYTPANGQSGSSQRIIRISDAHVDPLEPPKFKHKKVPRGPGSPPVPVMHSPPRKLTHQDQQDWAIPPCISNWKNRKGYTIPLDKRLAADGRGLQEVQINDNFAKLSEALYVAEQKAREAIDMRSKIQKEIMTKEKMRKEDDLRALAQKARLERTGMGAGEHSRGGVHQEDQDRQRYDDYEEDFEASRASRGGGPAYEAPPAESHGGVGGGPRYEDPSRENDFEENQERETREERDLRRKREELREERKRERERERRLEEREKHGFKKSKLTRDRDRDISEKVALGQARVGASAGGEALYDQRLFNQDQGMSSGLAADDAYNIYDKPLFADKGNSIYRPKASADDELYGQGGEEEAIRTERFKADKGFSGAEGGEGRSARGGSRMGGPVQFEKEADEQDPFDLEGLIGDVRGGRKPLDKIGKQGHMSANAGGADFESSGRKSINFRKGK